MNATAIVNVAKNALTERALTIRRETIYVQFDYRKLVSDGARAEVDRESSAEDEACALTRPRR